MAKTQTSKRHSAAWYAELAARLGHRGYVTLAEICQAEAVERAS